MGGDGSCVGMEKGTGKRAPYLEGAVLSIPLGKYRMRFSMGVESVRTKGASRRLG